MYRWILLSDINAGISGCMGTFRPNKGIAGNHVSVGNGDRYSDKKDGYHIQCNTEIIARKVILACGGRSYPSLGGCAEGARLAEKLGVKQEPQRPALCAVMTEENTEAVKGVRVACSAWFEEGNTEWKQSGELQITKYGLSGIMIFNLSSELGRILSEESSVKLYVDFYRR